MKTKICNLLLAALPVISLAQPTIINIENRAIGTIVKYKTCDGTSAFAGNGGSNQTWNFSGIIALQDTLFIKVVNPAATPHGSLYTGTSIAKEFSTGQFYYMNANNSGYELKGLVDTNAASSMTMTFLNTAQISVSPITFGTLLTDSFTNYFTASGYSFTGQGETQISGDGYGTLMLPGRTFSNTLRIKITHEEDDTLIQFFSVSHFSRVTYRWYDIANNSALLEIDSIDTGVSTIKTVKYLLDVPLNTTGIKVQDNTEFPSLYPNPASDHLNISANEPGMLRITNFHGQLVFNDRVNNKTIIPLDKLSEGIYAVSFESGASRSVSKLVIQRAP